VAIHAIRRNESASDYAIWPARHERSAGIDAGSPRPYIAAHAKRFYDRCQTPPPSLPRYGTAAHLRVAKIRAAGSAARLPDILPADSA
jgi:hypothetical protein